MHAASHTDAGRIASDDVTEVVDAEDHPAQADQEHERTAPAMIAIRGGPPFASRTSR